MFKTNLDLANVAALAVPLQRPLGHFHWDFWHYATFEHVRFLFEDTNYPTWLLNTLIVGAAVVGDHPPARDARRATRSRASQAAGARARASGSSSST